MSWPRTSAAPWTGAPMRDDHGSASTYANWDCRCDECRAAAVKAMARAKVRRVARATADPTIVPHGTCNGYGNYGCRCRPCTEAWTVACNARNRRRASTP